MSVTRIKINNFKSIKDCDICLKDNNVTCLIGKNGGGKSNILLALEYFFNNLSNDYSSENIIDRLNKYNQTATIEIVFDFESILNKSDVYANNLLKSKGYNIDYNLTIRDFNGIKSLLHWITKIKHCRKSKTIASITLTQNRQGHIAWKNADKELRSFIKRYYPIFKINTRNLDIYSWEFYWNIIKSLITIDSKTLRENEAAVKEGLYDLIREGYNESLSYKIGLLQEIFSLNEIKMDKFSYENRVIDLIKSYFGGDVFLKNKYSFDFYSDGTNSFNYLKLILNTVSKLSEKTVKIPILLFDELEIGLHPSKIEELIAEIRKFNNNCYLFITTHSPELICEIIKQDISLRLLKVDLIKCYSKIINLNYKSLNYDKHIITPVESRLYFSDMILVVEGESEFQLFRNKKILELYTKFKNVSIYNSCSNDQQAKNIIDTDLNLGIPYFRLFDMDKIIAKRGSDKYDSKGNFKLKSNVFNTDEHKKTFIKYKEKKELYSNIKVCIRHIFQYKCDTLYVDDVYYELLIKNLKDYYKTENVLLNSITIESTLINLDNLRIFIDFIKKYDERYRDCNMKTLFNNIFNLNDERQKLCFIRALYNGNTELLDNKNLIFNNLKFKELKPSNMRNNPTGISKTNGWITRWITFYVDTQLIGLNHKDAKVKFKSDFKELDNILSNIINML